MASTSQRHSCRPQYLLRSFIALQFFFIAAVSSLASGPGETKGIAAQFSPSGQRNQVFFAKTPFSSGWAVGDLDGDSEADLARAEIVRLSTNDGQYRINLDLSKSGTRFSFDVHLARTVGLNIDTRDVDGDHDLDLVITSGMLHRPVGLWLNDGEGHFSEADSSLFPDNMWRGPPRVSSNNGAEQDASAILDSSRIGVSSESCFVCRLPLQRHGNSFPEFGFVSLPIFAGQLYVRPPPCNSPSH